MIRFFAAILLATLGLCAYASGQDVTASPQKKIEIPPVSYGLVVDNSGSFRTLLDKVIEVTSDIVEENGADDEAFLVTFVDTPKIVLRQDFTDRKSELQDAAQNMFIEGGQTAILDAVKSAADYLAQNAKTDSGRMRALVLVTDGEERGSQSKIEDILKLLKDQNIRVFVIAMSDTKVSTKLLDRITKATGGMVVTPKGRGELSSAAKQVFVAMRTK
jgi:Mg-chelatase subunit ChlD